MAVLSISSPSNYSCFDEQQLILAGTVDCESESTQQCILVVGPTKKLSFAGGDR